MMDLCRRFLSVINRATNPHQLIGLQTYFGNLLFFRVAPVKKPQREPRCVGRAALTSMGGKTLFAACRGVLNLVSALVMVTQKRPDTCYCFASGCRRWHPCDHFRAE